MYRKHNCRIRFVRTTWIIAYNSFDSHRNEVPFSRFNIIRQVHEVRFINNITLKTWIRPWAEFQCTKLIIKRKEGYIEATTASQLRWWRPFFRHLFRFLYEYKPQIKFDLPENLTSWLNNCFTLHIALSVIVCGIVQHNIRQLIKNNNLLKYSI